MIKYVSEEDKAKAALDSIEKLVVEHDVLFLLLDSREARWLPSVLGSLYNKVRNIQGDTKLRVRGYMISVKLFVFKLLHR